MKNYEATGKTYEEALENGLQALGATISDVDITVLEEGSKGLFGLFGSRQAKVRLTLKETEEDLFNELTATKAEKKPASACDAGIAVSESGISHALIIDRTVIRKNLKNAGWNEKRLCNELSRLKKQTEDILLFSVNDAGETTIIYKERN